MGKRFIIQVDPLEIEDDAIIDTSKEWGDRSRMYECKSSFMHDICNLLNTYDESIIKLKKQLKQSIKPKFKSGQEVWCVFPTLKNREGFVFEYEFVGYTKDKIICCITENEEFDYDKVFATKEKAEKKLRELNKKENI